MTAKKEAKQLFDKYYNIQCDLISVENGRERAERWKRLKPIVKQQALIAVELHLEELSKMKLIFSDRELHYKKWQEVKQEIEKL